MSKKMRSFTRSSGNRRYKKMFVISAEGSKTEIRYFEIFNQILSNILIKCLKRKSSASSPLQVLKRMKNYCKKESIRRNDEKWIVIDKDEWTLDQIQRVLEWEKENINHGLALSNPKFEYWLLLHFEDGQRIKNIQELSFRLNKYLPDYKKDVAPKKFSLAVIHKAIIRAKHRDHHHASENLWNTTVYKLVENVLKENL